MTIAGGRRLVRAVVAALALAGTALAPSVAGAQGAEPDSALGRFLGGLADSTDRYFGTTTAPIDTSGLDSALVAGISRPPRRPRLRLAAWPDVRFDRIDGTSWGGGAGLGNPLTGVRLEGRARFAAGADTWLGGGTLRIERPLRGAPVRLMVDVGRMSATLDRDRPGRGLTTLRALVFGSDTRRLLRRDGVTVALEHERARWRVGVGFRDQLERPLPVTTTWNLLDRELRVPDNLPAWRGRARELRLSGGVRVPFTPLDLDVRYLTAGRATGSDFEYRRTRLSLGGDLGLGRPLALVPQLVYGRLAGPLVPQAAFYLGGGTLSTSDGDDRGGSGLALGRLDLVTTFDVLAAARLPHPDATPIQAGLFVSTGAVWGVDPYTGRRRDGTDWPRAGDWLPEAGVSLYYQPGLPTPDDLIRFDYAWPLGPRRGGPRIAVAFTRALELSRPRRKEDAR